MSRKNKNPHPRKNLRDRYDVDYVSLPEYPQYCSVVAMPMKTIYINVDADPEADDFYAARSFNDQVLKKLEKRLIGEVVA